MGLGRDPHLFTPRGLKVSNYTVRVNGLNLHVVDYGGSGEPVICVHGLTLNARLWDQMAERLVDRYHVIAFDVRGRGESDGPLEGYYDIKQYAEDASALCSELGIEKPVFMGHSMGASTGVFFANMYPARLSRLVLVDGGVTSPPEVHRALARIRGFAGQVYRDFDEYARAFEDTWETPSGVLRSFAWHMVNHGADGTVAVKVRPHAVAPGLTRQIPAPGDINANIKCPTLLLRSTLGLISKEGHARVVTEETAANLIAELPAGSKAVEIEGSNHMTILFEPYVDAAAKEIKEFLAKTI